MRDDVGRVMVDFTQMKAFAEDPLVLTEGDGIRVRDVDGRWYIDGLSGTFCLSLGHRNARVVEAASAQLSRLAVAAPTMATSDRSLELARELLALLPAQYTTLKWGSGGSEAIEAAIKMARQFHRQVGDARKFKVLSHYRAYHGVTGQALAASGWRAHKSPYEPLAPGFVHLHTPDPYRPPFDAAPAEVGATYVRLVEQVIELEGPETIAALVTEPVLMSAGVVIPPDGYLPALRQLCDRHDIVLVFDEIITGSAGSGSSSPPSSSRPGRTSSSSARASPAATWRCPRRWSPTASPRRSGAHPVWSSPPATRTRGIPSRARPDSRRWRRSGTATWSRTLRFAASRRSSGCGRWPRASRGSATSAVRGSSSASSSCPTPRPRSRSRPPRTSV